MITKRVNRYYCEHCHKGGCSAGHMRKHEQRCTLNPKRVCGMCKMLDQEQTTLADLIAMFPGVPDLIDGCYGDVYIRAVEAAMPSVIERAGECPACILAARKQAGVSRGLGSGDWSFRDACDKFWIARNQEEEERDGHESLYFWDG